ncbi:MAG: DMT family transporter [Desulfobacterales bacterium]|nr:DMT family transporter [Desulfobacterales bacterium]
MSQNTRPPFHLPFICLVILGAMPILSNSRPQGSDALGFSFVLSVWQTIFALPLFYAQLRQGKKGILDPSLPAAVKKRACYISVITGIMFGLATWCYVLSLNQAGTANAAIAIQSYPLFAVILEMVMLKQKKSVKEILAVSGLVAALYYLGTEGTWQLHGLSVWILVALCVPVLWSIAHVLIREELQTCPITPAQVTFFRVLLSTLFLGGLLLIIEPGRMADLFSPALAPYAMGMGLFYYLELVIWFYAIRQISVSVASAITTPWPGVTMVLSYFVLKEAIHSYQIRAFAAVIFFIYVLLVMESRKPLNYHKMDSCPATPPRLKN